MTGKLNKNVGFSLLPIAAFFLFEPGYAVYDLLPDFIGYIIVCIAIINLADLNSRVEDSFRLFRRAAMISVLRYVAIYFLEKNFSAEEHSVGTLLFAFVFAVAELVTLIPAYKSLLDGILHLGMLYDGSAPYAQKRVRGANATEKLYRLTFALVTVRALAMTLPEFTTLKTHSLYEFITLLRVFGVIVTLPIGIIWLVNFVKYCSSIRRDEAFIAKLTEKYTQNAKTNPQFYVARTLRVGIGILSAALVLSLDFYSNHINYIPDLIFYALIIISAVILRGFSGKAKFLIAAGTVGGAVSVFNAYSASHFMDNFYFSAIIKDVEAYKAYYTRFFAEIAEAITFIAVVFLILSVVSDVFKSHTDMAREGKDTFKRELRAKYKIGCIFFSIFALFSAMGGIYYVFSQPFYYEAWYFYYSIMISTALDIAFAAASLFFLGFIRQSIDFRYKLYL